MSKKKAKLLVPIIRNFLFLLLLGFVFSIYYGHHLIYSLIPVIVGIPFYGIGIYLYFEYQSQESKYSFSLFENDCFHFQIGKNEVTVRESEIKYLERIEVLNKGAGSAYSTELFGWNDFYFYRIITKKNEELIITCLNENMIALNTEVNVVKKTIPFFFLRKMTNEKGEIFPFTK